MPAINKLVSQWRQWINRNRTFTSHEMDELENHLLEEIDDLKQYEGLSEEEAFQKVVSVIGGREALDKEFVKAKPKFSISRINHWAHSQLWTIILCLILGSSFIIADLIYSKNHYTEVTQVIEKNLIDFQKIPENPLVKVFFDAISWYGDATGDTSQLIETHFLDTSQNYEFSKSHLSDLTSWNDATYRIQTKPKSIASVRIDETLFYLVLDSQNVMWLSKTKEFTSDTPHIPLKSDGQKNVVWENILLDSNNINRKASERIFQQTNEKYLVVNSYYWVPSDTSFVKKNNQNVIYLEIKGEIKLIKIEFFQMKKIYKQNPTLYYRNIEIDSAYTQDLEPIDCILWSEVKIIRKPIHLWNKLKESLDTIFFREDLSR